MTWTWPNSLMDFRACSDEIPPCSFETARRLLWRNINNELLPVYDRQLCECYLQPQILRCECLGDNKWVLNQKPLIIAQAFTTSITQIWVKPSGIPQIWVNPQIWAITQNWGNHAQVTQNWVLHLFLRVVIYLFEVAANSGHTATMLHSMRQFLCLADS